MKFEESLRQALADNERASTEMTGRGEERIARAKSRRRWRHRAAGMVVLVAALAGSTAIGLLGLAGISPLRGQTLSDLIVLPVAIAAISVMAAGAALVPLATLIARPRRKF